MENKDINRIKVMLVTKKRTSKWVGEQLEKYPVAVSKCCTNASQLKLEILIKISKLLEVN